MTRWIWVSLPNATFGISTDGGHVTDAAPIARWTVGRPEREVADWYRSRGAVFREAGPEQEIEAG